MDILKVEILEFFNLSIGKIGRIKFPDNKYPKVGMTIEFNDQFYKITRVVMFANPAESVINQDRQNNIYHCKVEFDE